MSGHTRHPDTDDLADFLAGLVSGTRGGKIASHVAQCQACAAMGDRLTEVSAELSAAPVPELPRQVERRIAAAILIETAARDAEARRAEEAGQARGAMPAASVPRRRWHERLWSRRVPVFSRKLTVPMGAVAAVAACLMLAVAGYLLSVPFTTAPSRAAAAITPGGIASGAGANGPAVTFAVTASGTDYQAATLGSQVLREIRLQSVPARTGGGAQRTAPRGRQSAAPVRASAQAAAGAPAPAARLIGCVTRLTGGRRPALVDRAFYDSVPVYVVAAAGRAWVVPRNCTSARPAVIRSVTLPVTATAPAGISAP
jgi:hypothetical protein